MAVIRLSGNQALQAVLPHIVLSSGSRLAPERITPRHAYLADFNQNGSPLDQVVLLYFAAPASYTGQDVVELSCHASPFIVRTIIETLTSEGLCRQARPGEFTQRSFLNGKLDLAKAEAVADLIAAQTQTQHRVAMAQLQGHLSSELARLREQLLRFTALMELELDFSEEDIEFANRDELTRLADQVQQHLQRLINSFKSGNAIREGIPVALTGPTNAGKSTLLNRLLGKDRAIVSNIHGTTRDTIEERFQLGGFLFRLIDTAGLRDTQDPIEQMGISRSREAVQNARIVLRLIDASLPSTPHSPAQEDLPASLPNTSAREVLLYNKVDLLSPEERRQLLQQPAVGHATTPQPPLQMAISARDGEGIAQLEETLVRLAQEIVDTHTDMILTNARHVEALTQAAQALSRVQEGLEQQTPADLLSPDLRLCINSIGEVTGDTITNHELLGHIFAHFCIGK